jgi:Raf kinase inhibitor-like YbhB/YbcL family protein
MLQLTSSAFVSGDVIPVRYTCEGDDVSPPLHWDDLPEAARALALVMDDPDAPRGTFTHWLVADLAPTPNDLEEGADLGALVGAGGAGSSPAAGINDFGRVGYGGPCPPRGHGRHRYQFRLYALDSPLGLERGFTRDEVSDVMSSHIIEVVEMVGTYTRG